MPYNNHRAFSTPKWENTIRRYISIPQLLSILEKQSLRFTRADKFNDPFEGTLPRKNIEEIEGEIGEVRLPDFGTIKYNGGEKRISWDLGNIKTSIEMFRKISYVNCWHMKEHETVAMWDSNIDDQAGVAVVSTARNLRDSLDVFKKNDVFIGEVEYIDFTDDKIPRDNSLHPYVYKRKGFEHENELRAVITSVPADIYPLEKKEEGEKIDFHWESQEQGRYISVDLDTLINEIRLSPNSPGWHKELIKDVLKRYGIDAPVRKSSLTVKPEYINK